MDYKKIKEEIKRRNQNENFFFPEHVGMTVQGFNKAVKNDSLKVRTLEAISAGLNVSVGFWYEGGGALATENEGQYTRQFETMVHDLRQTIKDLREDKKRLLQENEQLRDQLGYRKEGTSGS